MVGYTNLREQTDADFAHARRKALLRRIGTRLRNGCAPDRLLCFEDARGRLRPRSAIPLGLRVVHSTDVVGSVGRCSEFDRAFLPTRNAGRARRGRTRQNNNRRRWSPERRSFEAGSTNALPTPVGP
jgi:hypothetical protein